MKSIFGKCYGFIYYKNKKNYIVEQMPASCFMNI